VRIVQWLIGNKTFYVGGLEPGVVQTSFNTFKMKRVRRGVGPLSDFGFGDTDDGVTAADISHKEKPPILTGVMECRDVG
jgi:hypothetical protein